MQKNTEPKTEMQETLLQAWFEVYKQVTDPEKTATADAVKFSYQYAPLEEILPQIKKLCIEKNLIISHRPYTVEGEVGVVLEMIYVPTGEARQYEPFTVSYNGGDPQVVGKINSYLRRYSILNVFGLAPKGEDDDAQSIKGTVSQNKPEQKVEVDKDSCPHEHTAVREVKKEGPNKGKKFKACLDCKSFLGWHTETAMSAQDLASDFMASEEAYRV